MSTYFNRIRRIVYRHAVALRKGVMATVLFAVFGVALTGGATMGFHEARPVWPQGRSNEMNTFAGFRATFEADEKEKVIVRLTATSIYRLWINGEFLGHGPARGPLGFHRVDEYDVTGLLTAGQNLIAIEVAGYNVNSFYVLDQPAFLQAEIIAGGEVLAATGNSDGESLIEGAVLDDRRQKVQRYSFQRTFVEDYTLVSGFSAWRNTPDAAFGATTLEVFPEVALLPRRVPYSDFYVEPARTLHSRGTFAQGVEPTNIWKDRSLVNIGPNYKGFPEDELVSVLSTEMQKTEITKRDVVFEDLSEAWEHALGEGSFLQYDLGRNISGFPRFTIECREETRLFIVFDEILRGERIDFRRMDCVNIIAYDLQPGTYELEAFEPYTMRHLKIMALKGGGVVSGVGIRAFENTDTNRATFEASDERLERLYEAGRHTFAQNATDLFMDCPSRERAAWLCDSYFTARTALALSGDTTVEKNFLEAYALPDSFRHLPDGMLPMCYPADHYDGVFIPNWAMWFVIQLEEYVARSGDSELIETLRPRVMSLIEYFRAFENEDGLLESLEGWVFVEWSAANEFTQDVNFPSNMLYAGMLDVAADLYNLPNLKKKADATRQTIREQSYDGEFFVDNAVRNEAGILRVTRNRTEVCQYFAFFFGIATMETHPELWAKLRDDFGPNRNSNGAFPEVHPANSFIGNMVRMELLSQAGLSQKILAESVDYLMYMVERTNTLWEHTRDHASLNHGFASHIVVTLLRDILGLYSVDPVNKVIELRFIHTGLEWCSATVPVGDEIITLRWTSDGERITYDLDVPDGYTIHLLEHDNTMAATPGVLSP